MSVHRRLAIYSTAAILAMTLTLASCEMAVPLDSSEDVFSAGNLAASVSIPFAARFTTSGTGAQPDPACGSPPVFLRVHQAGEGEVTHMGHTLMSGTFCNDLSDLLDDGQLTEGESLPYFDGVGTFTAANGDELYFATSGAVLPSPHPDFTFEFHDTFSITGGTGRFEGASGGGTVEGFNAQGVNYHDWQGTLTFQPGRGGH